MKTLKLASILLALMLLTGFVSMVMACAPAKPGDVDGDGLVNLTDLVLTAHAWHSHDGDDNWDDRCDWNEDGYISLPDLIWVTVHYEG